MFTHHEFATVQSLAERLENLPTHVVYGQLVGRPEWGDAMERYVPAHMRSGFVWYVALGSSHQVGGFMSALLSNDLMGAFGRADAENIAAMPDWVRFLYNYAPAGCYGGQEKVLAWSGLLVEEEDA